MGVFSLEMRLDVILPTAFLKFCANIRIACTGILLHVYVNKCKGDHTH